MTQNGSEFIRKAQNSTGWFRMAPNCPEWIRIAQWLGMAQNGAEWFRMARNGSEQCRIGIQDSQWFHQHGSSQMISPVWWCTDSLTGFVDPTCLYIGGGLEGSLVASADFLPEFSVFPDRSGALDASDMRLLPGQWVLVLF